MGLSFECDGSDPVQWQPVPAGAYQHTQTGNDHAIGRALPDFFVVGPHSDVLENREQMKISVEDSVRKRFWGPRRDSPNRLRCCHRKHHCSLSCRSRRCPTRFNPI